MNKIAKSTFSIDFVKMEAMAVARLQFSLLDVYYSMSNRIKKYVKLSILHSDIIFDIRTLWVGHRIMELTYKSANLRR